MISLKNGFFYQGIQSVKVIYRFYVSGNPSNIIPLHDTYFSATSLTWNEGVAYIHDDFKVGANADTKAYINWNDYKSYQDIRQKKFITSTDYSYRSGHYWTFMGHGHALQNLKEETNNTRINRYYYNGPITVNNMNNYLTFDDWMGTYELEEYRDGQWKTTSRKSQDFDKAAVSFLLHYSLKEDGTFDEKYKTMYEKDESSQYYNTPYYAFLYRTNFKGESANLSDLYKSHACWIAHSTVALGMPRVPDPTKDSDKKEVIKDSTFTYKINQQLHEKIEGVLRPYEHYTDLELSDSLPKEVEFLRTRIKIIDKYNNIIFSKSYDANTTDDDGEFKITTINDDTGQVKIEYKFKNDYLNTLPLEGQKLDWEIDCKVKSDIAPTIRSFDNIGIINLGRVKYQTNPATIKILPPILKNTINKSAIAKVETQYANPRWITEKDDTIRYTITYTPSIQCYIGSAIVILEDKLPFPLDIEKTNEEVLRFYNYDSVNPKLVWEFEFNDINSDLTYDPNGYAIRDESGVPIGEKWTTTITREIDIVYNIPKSALAFRSGDSPILQIENTAKGTTSVENGDSVSAEAKYTISLDKRMRITLQKNWEDSGTEADLINRQNLKWITFVLYANGNETHRKVLKTNNQILDFKKEDIYMMPKYDENGDRIQYSVIEYVGGDENSLGEQLINTTGKKITELSKLYYYRDKYSKEEGVYQFEYDDDTIGQQTHEILTVTNTKTTIRANGNVWKDANKNGEREAEEKRYPAVEVKLYVVTYPDGRNAQYNEYRKILTDSNGNYTFDDLPWNGTYRIAFAYDGQVYEAITHKINDQDDMNNLTSGISNVKEIASERTALNSRFSTISSYPSNYGENKVAFGLRQKIDAYINDQPSYITLEQILGELEYSFPNTSYIAYEDAEFVQVLNNILSSYRINNETANQIKQYLKDCIMHAVTNNFYIKPGDIRDGINIVQYIDCALAPRPQNNLTLEKDVYQIRTVQNAWNSRTEYNMKPRRDTVEERSKNEYYTKVTAPTQKAENVYEQRILRSDYATIYSEEMLNLNVYVTYRITIRNIGDIDNVNIYSIIDYYDSNFFEPCTNLTFYTDLPNYDHSKYSRLRFNIEDNKITGNNYEYQKLTIQNNRGYLDTVPKSGEMTLYYVMKVKKDATGQRIQIKNPVNNIAEIGKYSTDGGYVDINSTPGNLNSNKLDEDGNLIYNLNSNSIEDDTDQIKFGLTIDNVNSRKISGYVFEDFRTEKDDTDTLKTTLGNGLRDNGETLINGVTVELYELVPEIDENGIRIGEVKDEILVTARIYYLDGTSTEVNPDDDYYSGMGSAVYVSDINDPALGTITPTQLPFNNGQYMFEGLPPGTYYVKFKYGDTTRTVLTNEINSDVNKAVGTRGLNAKSYNGQDYKTTIYQKDIDQRKSAYGVNGLIDLNKANYETIPRTADGRYLDKNYMIYSHLATASTKLASDALDIYDRREQVNSYSKTLNNGIEETLWSSVKMDTNDTGNKEANQINRINELINKTSMVAKTGSVFLTSIHNNAQSSSIDCGLVERPKSQIVLNKEIENMKIILHNNIVLFNTSKTVNNFYYSKHIGHNLEYDNYRLNESTIRRNQDSSGKDTPELLLGYLDEELLEDTKMVVNYKITARNMSEVDFNDKEFYYTGNETDPDNNISKAKVTKVIDYLNNSSKYDNTIQDANSKWIIETADNLINNKLVSKKYDEQMKTYNTLLVSEGMADTTLKPNIFKPAESEKSVGLVVQSILTTANDASSLTFNNLSEVVEIQNDQGRKSAFTKEGNQEMTNQNLWNNVVSGESRDDRRTPSEIDADSSQRIVLLPPTGSKYNYLLAISGIIMATGLILIGIICIGKSRILKFR